MFNLRWSVLCTAFGFVLSLLLSLVSGAGVFSFLRAVSFGGVFFVIGSFLYWMVKHFLPEILSSQDDGIQGLDLGSHVDISLDGDISSLAAALMQDPKGSPDTARRRTPDSPLDVKGGEILKGDGFGGGEDAVGILDQDGETGYTNKDMVGEFEPFSSPQDYVQSLGGGIPPKDGSTGSLSGKPSRAGLPGALPVGGGIDVLDVLPGQDGLSQAALPSMDDFMEGEGGGTPVSVAFPGVGRRSVTSESAEEFRGKEKASALALQTILKRE